MIQDFRYGKLPDGTVRVQLVRSGREQDFPVEFDKFKQGCADYKAGKLIQDAFPFLDDNQREFLMTGMTAGEWDHCFGED